jgi:hypothetical protein
MIAHSFDEENHIYKVPGHFVFATSDLISLAGLSSMEGIPVQVLNNASWRGDQVHLVTEYYENDCLDTESIPDEIVPYFAGYLKFCSDHEVVTVKPLERSIVYAFGDPEVYIGCHIDHRLFIDGKLFTMDEKSCYEYTGAAKKQNLLKWRMQLQSYIHASEEDEEFWQKVNDLMPGAADRPMGRMALHLHKSGGYTMYDFSEMDDEANWEATVRLAMLKLASGYKNTRR